jgi:peptide/nickel transport system ATP-binding protein
VSLVEVRDLRVELAGTGLDIVDEVTFSIEQGELVGLVGESGSGKTTIGMALLGHVRRGARITGGSVKVDDVDILDLSPRQLISVRGRLAAYIPQDPSAALNPAMRIRKQLTEMLEFHEPDLSAEELRERVRGVLREVKLPQDDEFLGRYIHQLSGGQQQRVAIAMAFILRPRLIVLDEPTTGLDVTTQSQVLATVGELCSRHQVAALYISHDLAVIASIAARVIVAYAGRTVEVADRKSLFDQPLHPYTRQLLASIPAVSERRKLDPIPGQAPSPDARPSNCTFAPRCPHALPACSEQPTPNIEIGGHDVRCLRARELASAQMTYRLLEPCPDPRDRETILEVDGVDAFYGEAQVLYDVGLSLHRGECLALVGESGSGKTTLARSIVGLLQNWRGTITYKGEQLPRVSRLRRTEVRRELQYIFQSPYSSLNPRRSIGESIAVGLENFTELRSADIRRRVAEALEAVSLPARYAERYPEQLSGGERQRVAIARALVCDPDVLICDEITSALDVSVQASIVRLLDNLQRERNLTLLFVTHNLALVRAIANRVVVLNQGRIVETGLSAQVLELPEDDYTRTLLGDTPEIIVAGSRQAENLGTAS